MADHPHADKNARKVRHQPSRVANNLKHRPGPIGFVRRLVESPSRVPERVVHPDACFTIGAMRWINNPDIAGEVFRDGGACKCVMAEIVEMNLEGEVGSGVSECDAETLVIVLDALQISEHG